MSDFEPPLDLDFDDDYDPSLDFPFFPEEDYIVPLPDESLSTFIEADFPPDDAAWGWHDARLIAVKHEDEQHFEIGAIDVYANVMTGDLGGSYLPIAHFDEAIEAEDFYQDLQTEIHKEAILTESLMDFAENKAFAMNPEPVNWRGAEAREYAAYEYLAEQDTYELAYADIPPDEAFDPLLATALELGGVLREETLLLEEDTQNALKDIGIQAETHLPSPTIYDEATGTSYWVGVFQADKNDPENCIASILSLGKNETGELEAQLAPCVPGNWDKAHDAAAYLIQIAERGGLEQLFDAAEGMALATEQREFWETERGVAIEQETIQNWELDL